MSVLIGAGIGVGAAVAFMTVIGLVTLAAIWLDANTFDGAGVMFIFLLAAAIAGAMVGAVAS